MGQAETIRGFTSLHLNIFLKKLAVAFSSFDIELDFTNN